MIKNEHPQHEDLHTLPEDAVRHGGRVPDKEERHSHDHTEQVAGLLAEEAVPQDEEVRYRHPKVGQALLGPKAQGEEAEGCPGHKGLYQR